MHMYAIYEVSMIKPKARTVHRKCQRRQPRISHFSVGSLALMPKDPTI